MSAAGCTSAAPQVAESTSASRIEAAAAEAHVPADLVLAIAVEERGLRYPAWRAVSADDHVPVAGALELRRGRLDTLALGASLAGTSEAALRADTELGTRAGTLVLAWLGAKYGAGDDLASWRRAVEVMSGLDDAQALAYASRVLAILRDGGEFPARAGETVRIAAHRELVAAPEVLVATPGVADFPGAIWFTTDCSNKCTIGRPLGASAVDKIVIHDTEGDWDASVATLEYDPAKSVHYVIDADGSRVGQFRPETDTTWHAGNYYFNETSIGIEHVGVASDPSGYSAGLYATSRDLVQSIRTRWSVPLDRTHIIGHYQIPDGDVIAESSVACTDTLDACETSASYGGSNNHRDPGYYWQWCQYMQALGGTCTCNDAWPLWNCTTDHTEAVRCVDGTVEIEACPNGCDVMPVGTDDDCHTAIVAPDAGVPAGDAGDGMFPADPATPGDHGGCAAGGGSPLAILLALGGLRRRERATGRRSGGGGT